MITLSSIIAHRCIRTCYKNVFTKISNVVEKTTERVTPSMK